MELFKETVEAQEGVFEYKYKRYRLLLIPTIDRKQKELYIQEADGGHLMVARKLTEGLSESLDNIINNEEYLADLIDDFNLHSFVLQENVVNEYRE